jgi:hypothetical protein
MRTQVALMPPTVNQETYQKQALFVKSAFAYRLIMKQGVLCGKTNIKIVEAMNACRWFTDARYAGPALYGRQI